MTSCDMNNDLVRRPSANMKWGIVQQVDEGWFQATKTRSALEKFAFERLETCLKRSAQNWLSLNCRSCNTDGSGYIGFNGKDGKGIQQDLEQRSCEVFLLQTI